MKYSNPKNIIMKNVITALLLCISIGASAQTMGNPMPNVSAEENPLQTINNTPGLCAIFRTWGFIGDSLCSGEMESRDENGNTRGASSCAGPVAPRARTSAAEVRPPRDG